MLGRFNSRKSLICPCDGLPAGRFPGRAPTPGVVPRLGSTLGLGLVTPPLGSRVLGIPLLGSRLLGIDWQSTAGQSATVAVEYSAVRHLAVRSSGALQYLPSTGIGMEVAPSMVDLATADLASPKVYQSRASADSSKEKIPWMEQCCVRASASMIDPGSCRLHHASRHRHQTSPPPPPRIAPPPPPPGYAGRLPLDKAKG